MVSLTLADLMTPAVIAIESERTLGGASERLAAAQVSSLLVVEGTTPVGILTERDLLHALHRALPVDTPVEAVMSRPVISAPVGTPVLEAYHLLTQRRIRHLLITDAGGRPAGIVSESDFRFHLGADLLGRLRDVRSLMTPRVPAQSRNAKLSDAVAHMERERTTCVVVVEGNRPVGMVTERDVARLFRLGPRGLDTPLAEVMTWPAETLNADAPPQRAIERMRTLGLRHLVVVEDDGSLAGLLTGHDVVGHLDEIYVEQAVRAMKQVEASLELSEARRRTLWEQTTELLGLLAPDGTLLDCNPTAARIAGKPVRELTGKLFWELPWWTHDPALQAKLREAIGQAATRMEPQAFEVNHPDGAGGLVYVDFRLQPVPDSQGKVAWLIAQGVNITERRRDEEQLRLAASVFANTNDGVLITDPRGVMLDVNDAFCRITGYGRDECVGRTPAFLKSGHQDELFYRDMWQALLTRGHWEGEVWNRKKGGDLFVELLTIDAVRNAAGQLAHYVGVISDITRLKENQAHLERIAHYDPLTRLPNRALLADRLRQALAAAQRKERLLAVCYLDLDNFKPVNDTMGHGAGDRLLVEIARRLEEAVRSSDTVARLGGDEFVLLINDLATLAETEQTLTRVLNRIADPFEIAGREVRVTGSLGVTLYPVDGVEADILLQHADLAMYRAKQAGRNGYHLFDAEHDRRMHAHRDEMVRLEEALAKGEFELIYQPIFSLRSGDIAGAEALLRWRHPERGLLLPKDFIHGIEQSQELALRIGRWTLDAAIAQGAAWHSEGLALNICVNVFSGHLLHPGFPDEIARTLAAHPNFPAGALELEIREDIAFEHLNPVSRTLTECRRMGIRLSIDDFGSGLSSLTFFKRMPVQTLKIERSFVAGMFKNSDDIAVVEGVIGLAAAFHLQAAAKAVETAQHLMLLTQLGCHYAQGYAIAPPMPAANLPAWVRGYVPEASWESAVCVKWPREDLPLLVVGIDHETWLTQLEEVIDRPKGPFDTREVIDDHACPFGIWYHGPGRERYGTLEEFRLLGEAHERVHAIGREILCLRNEGKVDKIRQEQWPAMLEAKENLLEALHLLQATVVATNSISRRA